MLSGRQLLRAAVRRDVRTSQGTFVSRDEDPDGVLAWVEEKTAQITGIPSGHGEVRVALPPQQCIQLSSRQQA